MTRPDKRRQKQARLSLHVAQTGKLVPNTMGQLHVNDDCCDCTPSRVIIPNSDMRATHDGTYRPNNGVRESYAPSDARRPDAVSPRVAFSAPSNDFPTNERGNIFCLSLRLVFVYMRNV